MPSAEPTSQPLPTDGPTAGGDDLDDLFNYDFDDPNDPFSDNFNVPVTTKAAEKDTGSKGKGDGLGLDEEVDNKKVRIPRVKLDEHRLLSAAGIPKLRKKAKDHLKFKGKGHEYSDISKLLAFYQLWLDDLFPKARFLDALAMVEKMGHKKMMQSMRMEWINEGKPHSSVHEDSLFNEPALPPRENGEREKTASRIAPIFEKTATERPKTPSGDVDADIDMDDLYDATPRPVRREAAQVDSQDSLFGGTSLFGPAKVTAVDDAPPEDDLDALLAEEEMLQAESAKSKPAPANKGTDSFDDEMEAMAEMDDLWDM